jgi:hypothetical protein
MKNAPKIKKIFIGINVILFSMVSCENSSKRTDQEKSTKLNMDFSSQVNYHIVYPKEIDPESIHIDSLYVQVAYQLNANRLILIGKSNNEDPQGLKMLLVNPKKNYKLIYGSNGAWESWTLHPTFFEPDKSNNPMVILAALGTSESWGQQVFLMKEDTINEIGYIDVTLKKQADTSFYEDGFQLMDIGPFTKIKTQNGLLNFSFNTDSILYYGTIDNQYDITLPGYKLEYNFDGDSLKIKAL